MWGNWPLIKVNYCNMYKSSTRALTWCGSQVFQVSSIRNFPLGFKSAINAVLALIRWKSSIVSSILAKSPSNSWEKGRVISGTITSVSFPRFRTIDLETWIFPKRDIQQTQPSHVPSKLASAVAAMASKCRTAFVEPPGMTQLSLTDIPKRGSLGFLGPGLRHSQPQWRFRRTSWSKYPKVLSSSPAWPGRCSSCSVLLCCYPLTENRQKDSGTTCSSSESLILSVPHGFLAFPWSSDRKSVV